MRQTTFKRKSDNKKVLIPFSGGIDSTYLVFKNLEEGNDVHLTRFNIENNEHQMEIECEAIKDLIHDLQKHFPNAHLLMRSYEKNNMSNQSFEVTGSHMIYGPQPPLWVFCLAYDENLWEVDEVQMGYISGDDALSYLDDIKKLYRAFSPFLQKKAPPLKFPLIKNFKWELWNYLPDNIKKNTVFCEYSRTRYEPCGKCNPCLTMMYTELWEEWHELNDSTPKIRYERTYPKLKNESYDAAPSS